MIWRYDELLLYLRPFTLCLLSYHYFNKLIFALLIVHIIYANIIFNQLFVPYSIFHNCILSINQQNVLMQKYRSKITLQSTFRHAWHILPLLYRWGPSWKFVILLLHRIKLPQHNRFTDKYEICENAFGLLLIPFAMTWLIGHIYNKVMLDSKVNIPLKNSALTAGAVTIASIFSILAIQKTSFTVVIMF